MAVTEAGGSAPKLASISTTKQLRSAGSKRACGDGVRAVNGGWLAGRVVRATRAVVGWSELDLNPKTLEIFLDAFTYDCRQLVDSVVLLLRAVMLIHFLLKNKLCPKFVEGSRGNRVMLVRR